MVNHITKLTELYEIQMQLVEANPWHPDLVERLETAVAIRIAIKGLKGY